MSESFSLLDSSIDELADLEKFTPIPAGTHKLTFNWSKPDDEEKVIVALKMTVVETLEMANSSEPEPEPGKTSNMRFTLSMKDGSPVMSQSGKPNLFGQGQLKEILLALQPVFGGATLQEVMDNSEGAEVIATLKVRPSKNDPDNKFNEIKAILVDTAS